MFWNNVELHLWASTSNGICLRIKKRLSNFLLFQAAYAEIFFVDKLWPDFTRDDFKNCLDPTSHTSKSHFCLNCGGRNHTQTDCLLERKQSRKRKRNEYNVDCPCCNNKNIFTLGRDNISIFICSMCQKTHSTKTCSHNKCFNCETEKSNIVLPICKHCCLCTNCLDELNQNSSKSKNKETIPDKIASSLKYVAKKNMSDKRGKIYFKKWKKNIYDLSNCLFYINNFIMIHRI